MGIGKQAKILTDKQQAVMMNYIEGTRYPIRNKVIFLLSFKAGLRAKEIANITWAMVCSADGEIGGTINLPNIASKGASSGRIIPMHKHLKEALSNLLNHHKAKDGFSMVNNVVDSERGCKTSPQMIVNFFANLYKIVGIEGCSSHSGRRTFITNAAKNISLAGGTLNDVKMLAGHSTLSTTQRYIEYDTNAQKRLVELV